MDYRRMTAPCGLDCFNCPMYLANDNEGLRARIAENLKLPPAQAVCRGCRDESGTIGFLKMETPCNVYRCIESRGHSFCSECDDFPCDHLHPYADRAAAVPHNTKVFNLCLIRKLGLDAWAESKARQVKETYFKGRFTL
jgi:hypothetical protein